MLQTKWQNLFSRFQLEYHRCFLLYFSNHAHQMFLTKNVHNIVKEQHTKLHLQNDLVVSVGLAVRLRGRYKEKKDCSFKRHKKPRRIQKNTNSSYIWIGVMLTIFIFFSKLSSLFFLQRHVWFLSTKVITNVNVKSIKSLWNSLMM